MADQRTQYPTQQQRPGDHAVVSRGSHLMFPGQDAGSGAGGGASTKQIVAVVTLVPLGGVLLLISGVTLAATLLGLAVAAPVFLLFSPVLVPAALALSLAVVGFLASGGFGIAGISSLSWLAGYIRQLRDSLPEKAEHARWGVQDAAGYTGQKAKEVGETVQSKAQEPTGRSGAQEAKKT